MGTQWRLLSRKHGLSRVLQTIYGRLPGNCQIYIITEIKQTSHLHPSRCRSSKYPRPSRVHATHRREPSNLQPTALREIGRMWRLTYTSFTVPLHSSLSSCTNNLSQSTPASQQPPTSIGLIPTHAASRRGPRTTIIESTVGLSAFLLSCLINDLN